MQNFILRVNVSYTDPDEEKKKQASGPLNHSISKEWYPHSLLFAALLAILVGWIFYMLRGVFGLSALDFHNDNLVDACFILLTFILSWSFLSFVSFVLGVLRHRQEPPDKISVSLPGAMADIAMKPGVFYSIIAVTLYIVLLILDGVKDHPPQLVALAMVALLLFACLWLRIRTRALNLLPVKNLRNWAQLWLRRLINQRQARRTRAVGTSFATLTKYYLPAKRKEP